MRAQEIHAALDRHWTASDANDFETGHDIYHEDAVLEYPQSGERIRGRRNIQITRSNQPSKKRSPVREGASRWLTIRATLCTHFLGIKGAGRGQILVDAESPEPGACE